MVASHLRSGLLPSGLGVRLWLTTGPALPGHTDGKMRRGTQSRGPAFVCSVLGKLMSNRQEASTGICWAFVNPGVAARMYISIQG